MYMYIKMKPNRIILSLYVLWTFSLIGQLVNCQDYNDDFQYPGEKVSTLHLAS